MAEEFTPSYTFTDDRLNELKQIFPESFEDGVFNVDTLKELIGEFSTDNSVKEHFGLNWVGKNDARKIAAVPPTGTLKPCPGEGLNEDTTENIFIEGENLEVLKILRKSYMNKIKMIYIDPPYNTGTDFIYKDSFADNTEDYLRKSGEMNDEGLLVSNPKSSGKYHANWLSFMYPRLRVAKDLLKDDGIVFISIDDKEIDNLRLLCDEIFGEENFIEQIVWKSKYGAGAQTKGFISVHEYILCYSKNPLEFIDSPLDEEAKKAYNKKDEKFESRGGYFTQPLMTNSLGDRSNLQYNIQYNGEIITPKKQWVWSRERLEKAIENDEVVFNRKSNNEYSVRSKQYLYDENGKERKGKPISILNGPFTQEGTADIEELFGYNPFGFVKPVNLIKHFFSFSLNNKENENEIFLDFFAGSGTTAQSLYRLNSNFSSKNKFICVQIPVQINSSDSNGKKAIEELNKKGKPTLITELTKERIRLADDKEGNNTGFKVFKQHSSTIYKWQDFIPEKDGGVNDLFSKLELQYKNPLQDGVTTQDFITEVILQEGFPLTSKKEEVLGGVFKITHEWIPYTLYVSMLYNFKDTDFTRLELGETDHFVCLDKAFAGNDALKQEIDNKCKLYTI
jgi:adenine-specific DNA-methyltransferase